MVPVASIRCVPPTVALDPRVSVPPIVLAVSADAGQGTHTALAGAVDGDIFIHRAGVIELQRAAAVDGGGAGGGAEGIGAADLENPVVDRGGAGVGAWDDWPAERGFTLVVQDQRPGAVFDQGERSFEPALVFGVGRLVHRQRAARCAGDEVVATMNASCLECRERGHLLVEPLQVERAVGPVEARGRRHHGVPSPDKAEP